MKWQATAVNRDETGSITRMLTGDAVERRPRKMKVPRDFNEVHITPVGDSRDHKLSVNCDCQPRLVKVTDGRGNWIASKFLHSDRQGYFALENAKDILNQ